MSSTEQLKISLQDILSATNKFAEENIIGRGGYGVVYRGRSKQHGVLAIKRLNRGHGQQGDHEYGMEVTLLSKYKHENLVSLVGFCGEGEERILVYKYETNQSLDKFLNSKDLSWTRRLEICLGAARGLRYLHNGESGHGHGVIHRDIKSSNILLDEKWKAKIADFGLSKLVLTNSADSVIFTVPCGTYGYVDPQILYGGITQKSDVYSFGVVLYEVLFGKLATIPGHLVDGRFTVKMAKKHYEQNTLHMMIDPELKDQMKSNSMTAFSTIAYECLKDMREDRPTMSLVVEALEKALRYQLAVISRKNIVLSSDGFLHDVFICFYRHSESMQKVNDICDSLEGEGLSIYKGNFMSSYEDNSIFKDNFKSFYDESQSRLAISQSRFLIIAFSRDFGDSSLNLDELVEIMKSVKERGNIALPIYLEDVDPSCVLDQSDVHIRRRGRKIWQYALDEATDLSAILLASFNNDVHDLANYVAAIIKRQLLERAEKITGMSPAEEKTNSLDEELMMIKL